MRGKRIPKGFVPFSYKSTLTFKDMYFAHSNIKTELLKKNKTDILCVNIVSKESVLYKLYNKFPRVLSFLKNKKESIEVSYLMNPKAKPSPYLYIPA